MKGEVKFIISKTAVIDIVNNYLNEKVLEARHRVIVSDVVVLDNYSREFKLEVITNEDPDILLAAPKDPEAFKVPSLFPIAPLPWKVTSYELGGTVCSTKTEP